MAWVHANNFVSENDRPIEFTNHRFMIDPFSDLSPDLVCMKSAQVGFSVMSILKTFWLAKYRGINTGYVLPTHNVVKDFVTPKVDPLIMKNPALREMVSKDSVSLKQVGDRFVYYRGSFSEREAIAISLDMLIMDELDRCEQKTLTTYQSRLQASDFGWQHKFSNPSVPNFGVHDLWLDSDQMHWFVKCSRCNHESHLTFDHEEEMHTHFIDRDQLDYVCGKCRKPLTTANRINGRWIPKHPSRERRGYHMSQLLAPWVSAKDIVKSYNNDSTEFFYNFVLGLPYIAADIVLDRTTIMNAISPGTVKLDEVCIGVDNGIVKTWVAATPTGVFRYGETESWDDIENLFNMYNAKAMVIDANPYPVMPKKLTEKYPGRVFMNYYSQDTKQVGIVRWGENDKKGIVYSDRTKILDFVANEITNRDLVFAMKPTEMEKFIYHATNVYRTVEEDNNGMRKGKWITKEGKPDHLLHALVYCRTALTKAMQSSGQVVDQVEPGTRAKKGYMTDGEQIGGYILDPARVQKKGEKDWQYS